MCSGLPGNLEATTCTHFAAVEADAETCRNRGILAHAGREGHRAGSVVLVVADATRETKLGPRRQRRRFHRQAHCNALISLVEAAEERVDLGLLRRGKRL